MSEDAAVAAGNIAFEDGEGANVPLPAELALTSEPVAEAAPVAVIDTSTASPETVPNPDPHDPAKAGILSDLTRTRRELKTLEQFRDQASPLLVALQRHPDLLAEIQARETGHAPAPRPKAEPGPTAPNGPSNDELAQLATDLVLYKADGSGQPDIEAARRIFNRQQQQVSAAVQSAIREHVAPLQQNLNRTQGQSAKDAIMQTAKSVGADGPELEQMLDGFLASDPSLLQNPQIGIAAIMMARGMKGLTPVADGAVPAAVVPPVGNGPNGVPNGAPAPVFMERPGARTPTPVTLSPIEQRSAKARSLTPEAWGALTSPLVNAAKGQQHIVLEND